ncbi:MAG: hypothetical protein HC836_31875 [Richelia sp. RM2_1_2]|nr:hypothetical protein [Richelia sp. RM2_1_2]
MIVESSLEALDLIKDRAEAIWNKVQKGTIDKKQLSTEVNSLENEIKILKELEGFDSLEEERQYAILNLLLKLIKQEYGKIVK